MSTKEKVLLEKWSKILDSKGAPKFKDSHRRLTTAKMLEQQMKHIKGRNRTLEEAAPANSGADFPAATNMKGYDPILISLVRRAAPQMIAFDICGVQAMSGPTGLVFAIKAKYTSQGGTEALFDESDSDFSGSQDSGETQTGTFPIQSTSAAYRPGQAMTNTIGEGLGAGSETFQQMAFSIDKVTATARTRKLKAEYSIELEQDLEAVHGLSARTELSNILSTEILSEINREVVRRVYHDAKPGAQYGTDTAGTFDLDSDADGRWSVEKWKGLMFQLEKEANDIAKDTRRGRGNFIICSSNIASALSSVGLLDVAPALKDNLSVDDANDTFCGVLNGRFKVFIDPYVASGNTDFAIVGYKGSNPFDAGLFYCPYIPLMMQQAIDPNTFQPKIAYLTRYAMVSNPFANSAGDGTLVFNANKYYRKLNITGL